MEIDFMQDADSELERVQALLGGKNVLGRHIRSMLDAHDVISIGFPAAVLTYISSQMELLQDPDRLQKALGISLRTLQRHKDEPNKALSQEQSGRAWKFAEIVSKATSILGSLEAAQEWLMKPAVGLEQRCPIDLLSTPAGIELVEDLLERMEYGVYA
jgi:putative toxin-antitoxin system antitoxin component (TIGR02293 family)